MGGPSIWLLVAGGGGVGRTVRWCGSLRDQVSWACTNLGPERVAEVAVVGVLAAFGPLGGWKGADEPGLSSGFDSAGFETGGFSEMGVLAGGREGGGP